LGRAFRTPGRRNILPLSKSISFNTEIPRDCQIGVVRAPIRRRKSGSDSCVLPLGPVLRTRPWITAPQPHWGQASGPDQTGDCPKIPKICCPLFLIMFLLRDRPVSPTGLFCCVLQSRSACSSRCRSDCTASVPSPKFASTLRQPLERTSESSH